MTGTGWEVWLAAAMLLLTHFGVSSTPLRGVLIRTLGEGPYRGLYSVVATVVLVWLVLAYNAAGPQVPLWRLEAAAAYLAIVLMPLSLFLLVGGLSAPNPTAVGSERHMEDPRPVSGVLRITRNPVLWAIGLWAVAHLVANGEPRGIALFGSLAVLALAGTLALDHRNRRTRPMQFAPFEMSTSNLPFLAIVQGRQSLGKVVKEFGWLRLVVVVALYAGLLHGHTWLFGVTPYPPPV
jgi:uncharacterized membrane protein